MKKARSSGRLMAKQAGKRAGSSVSPAAGGVSVPSSTPSSRSSSRSKRAGSGGSAKASVRRAAPSGSRGTPKVDAGIAGAGARRRHEASAARQRRGVARGAGETPPWKAKNRSPAAGRLGLAGMDTAALPGNTQVRHALKQVRGALRDVGRAGSASPSEGSVASSGSGARGNSTPVAIEGDVEADDGETEEEEEEEELVEHEVDAGDMGDDLMVALAQARRRRLEQKDGAEVDTPAVDDAIEEGDEDDHEGEGQSATGLSQLANSGRTESELGFKGPASAVLASGPEAARALPSPELAHAHSRARGSSGHRRGAGASSGSGTGFSVPAVSKSSEDVSSYVYEEDSESSDDGGSDGDGESHRGSGSRGASGGSSGRSQGFGKVTIKMGIQAAIAEETRQRLQLRSASQVDTADLSLRPSKIKAPSGGADLSLVEKGVDHAMESPGSEWIPGLVLPPELLE